MPRKSVLPLPDLVRSIDFPHKRHGGEWLQKGAAPENKAGFSHDRLVFYAGRLRELGMSDIDIQCMFGDLYWDAFTEFGLNDTHRKLEEKEQK
jgi:hypothetical protein